MHGAIILESLLIASSRLTLSHFLLLRRACCRRRQEGGLCRGCRRGRTRRRGVSRRWRPWPRPPRAEQRLLEMDGDRPGERSPAAVGDPRGADLGECSTGVLRAHPLAPRRRPLRSARRCHHVADTRTHPSGLCLSARPPRSSAERARPVRPIVRHVRRISPSTATPSTSTTSSTTVSWSSSSALPPKR